MATTGIPLLAVRACGVLIADDELDIRELLSDGLRHEGFAVWLAADGAEALDVYRNQREAIDVVLLDVRMPILDGPATLSALQKIAPQIPCCFMSGDLGPFTEERLCQAGSRALLKKPFQIREMARLLREIAAYGLHRPERRQSSTRRRGGLTAESE